MTPGTWAGCRGGQGTWSGLHPLVGRFGYRVRLVQLAFREVPVKGFYRLVDLGRTAEAYKRRTDRGLTALPLDRELRQRAAVSLGDGFELAGGDLIRLEVVLLEERQTVRVTAGPDLVAERDRVELPDEPAVCQGTVREDADTGVLAIWHRGLFRPPVEHVVADLVGRDRTALFGSVEQGPLEVRDSDVTRFAFVHEAGSTLPSSLRWGCFRRASG